MPATVIASRGHSESSDDLSSDGETSLFPPRNSRSTQLAHSSDNTDDNYSSSSSLKSDDNYSSSSGNKSDDSSRGPSTPEHSTKVVTDDEIDLGINNEPDTELPGEENNGYLFNIFKFKRKKKIVIYEFLRKLRNHLIMWLKFLLFCLLVLTTIQLG